MQFVEFLGLHTADIEAICSAMVYVAIAVLFLLGVIKCISPVLSCRRMLARAVRQLRSASSSASATSKQAWQDKKFLGRGQLYPHWSEYLNNLFFANGAYHNPSSVEDYINEETVIYGPGRSSFAEALPGLLVSLGFMGTLIGLSMGLAGFSMNDTQAVQDSIVTLIPGMRYAFMTSIAGVVGSVAFTVLNRTVQGSTEHTLRNFYAAMGTYAGVHSVDPMTQIAIYQQEQTALIQTMSKDLNGKFTQTMADVIRTSVEPVNQSLKNFITVTTTEQMRFLDMVAQRFVDRMDDSLQGKLLRFGQVLESTSKAQIETFEQVEESLRQTNAVLSQAQKLSGTFTDLRGAFSQWMDGLLQAQKKSDDAYMRMAGSVEQMSLVSREQVSYLKNVSSMQANVSRSLDELAQNMDAFAQALARQQEKAVNALQGAADSLNKSGENLGGIHDRAAAQMSGAVADAYAKAAKQIGTATATMMDAQAVASRHLEEGADRMDRAAQGLVSAHADAAQNVSREAREVLNALSEYAAQFEQRVDYLTGAIDNTLKQVPGAVSDTTNQFLDQVDQLTDALARAQTALNQAADRLQAPDETFRAGV